jgi:hypothetical protein
MYIVSTTDGGRWRPPIYEGEDESAAHHTAQKHVALCKLMGEGAQVISHEGLTVYRRGPDGVERQDF